MSFYPNGHGFRTFCLFIEREGTTNLRKQAPLTRIEVKLTEGNCQVILLTMPPNSAVGPHVPHLKELYSVVHNEAK